MTVYQFNTRRPCAPPIIYGRIDPTTYMQLEPTENSLLPERL